MEMNKLIFTASDIGRAPSSVKIEILREIVRNASSSMEITTKSDKKKKRL